jgi:hypothetical protein
VNETKISTPQANKSKSIILWLTALTIITGSIAIQSCGSNANDENNAIDEKELKIAKENEALVKTACANCHAFVPADKLDKTTWEAVIKVMASKMGIYEHNGETYFNEKSDPNVDPSIYPSSPTISHEDLDKIFHYYQTLAPDALPNQSRKDPIAKDKGLFQLNQQNSMFPAVGDMPMTTFVSIVPGKNQIVIGSFGEKGNLSTFNTDGSLQWSQDFPSAPTWVDFSNPNQWLVTCIGSVQPTNAKIGSIHNFNPQSKTTTTVANEVARPVMSFRLPNSKNILINAFGHLKGQTYTFNPNTKSTEQVLRDIPGAICSRIADWDGDGKKDILTLFAQNKESIIFFKNTGTGFQETATLLERMPVYGSNSFDLADMNQDGKLDIVYTCGDNADYSVILKDYHGVYVYLNQGNNKTKEAFFYPIHGCFKALARDFDLDGDQDIITVSFFADFISQHEEAAVYLENSKMNFKPSSLPGYDLGRWLTMDAGDADGDGDQDLVFGNLSMGPESFITQDQVKKFATGPACVYYKNTTR